MKAKTNRLLRGLALVIALGAIAAPAASAVPSEQFLPSATGAVQQQESSYNSVNALAPPSAPSPTASGTRDGEASSYSSVNALAPPSASSPTPASGTVAGDGFDWGDAGVGAASMLALAAIAAGAALVVGLRPRRRQKVA